jgi:hypothetical protein
MTDPRPIAWRAVVYGTPVIADDGATAGEVHEVLGSDADDIFHGLRVALAGRHRDVMVAADHVTSLTTTEVRTDLTRSDLDALPTYEEEATYHLASVGWLRKHQGWKKDSEGDEEPG